MQHQAGSRTLIQQLQEASVDGCNAILKYCIIFWVNRHDARLLLLSNNGKWLVFSTQITGKDRLSERSRSELIAVLVSLNVCSLMILV